MVFAKLAERSHAPAGPAVAEPVADFRDEATTATSGAAQVARAAALVALVAWTWQFARAPMGTVGHLSPEQIWARPGGAASIGFHMRHAAGSLDRLFTYARGEQLSAAQLATLKTEGEPDLSPQIGATLIAAFDEMVERALEQLRATDESTLLDAREVGRARLPSTVVGLLFHAAEHTQRHSGQIATTARIVSHG